LKNKLTLVSRAMQAGMVGIAAAGVATGDLTRVFAALISLFITEVPSLLRRDIHLVLPLELNFWIVLALFLHVVGGFSGFYDHVPGWDHITHMTSASLIGALGFVVVVTIDKYADSIYLPRPFLAFFIVMFTMAMGVIWEIMEYANDALTGSHLQYSLADTMYDLLFDGFAGFVVAIVGAQYLIRVSPEHFAESLDVEEAKRRMGNLVRRRSTKP
jgi:4-hydroxybenzoate polyprenyltransferase